LSFGQPNGAALIWGLGAAIVGLLLTYAMTHVPPSWRRPIVAIFTFLAGAVYVLYFLWPKAQDRGPHDIPRNMTESVAFFLQDAIPVAGNIGQTLTIFLLGLGIYSLMRIHLKRLFGGHKDAFFSAVVIVSMLLMVGVGYWNYWLVTYGPNAAVLSAGPAAWTNWNKFYDFLFDGLYQTMDAAMFSIIAFYILSAAYRAFRIRSIEATILLAAALLVMLSLMGPFVYGWNMVVGGHGAFVDNFKIDEIATWIRKSFQEPGIRALDFGVGLGALAMGLRLWLSLEKGGVS
jgi:hypothetical protein